MISTLFLSFSGCSCGPISELSKRWANWKLQDSRFFLPRNMSTVFTSTGVPVVVDAPWLPVALSFFFFFSKAFLEGTLL